MSASVADEPDAVTVRLPPTGGWVIEEVHTRRRSPIPGVVVGLLTIGTAALAAASVLGPWAPDQPAMMHTRVGIAILVGAGILAFAGLVDVVTRRVRWSPVLAAPPLALLVLVASTVVAEHRAGLPWPTGLPDPFAGPGPEMFLSAQVLGLVVGLVGAVLLVRPWDDDPTVSRSPYRATVVLFTVVASLALIVTAGFLLTGHLPT